MLKLKRSDLRQIDKWFETDSGYILDFTNRSFAEFFEDELGIDIYAEQYAAHGSSKANRFRCYIQTSSHRQVSKALRALWTYKNRDRNSKLEQKQQLLTSGFGDPEGLEVFELPYVIEDMEFEEFVSKIENMGTDSSIQELHSIAKALSFDTVLKEAERAREFIDDDPEDAITASCSLIESVCKSIIVELGMELPKKLTLKEAYRAVREPLGLSAGSVNGNDLVANDIRSTLMGLVGVIEGIGALRSHGGDAHGRAKGSKPVDSRIARLAVNAASSIAIFLIQTWELRYPNRELRNVVAMQK